MDFTQYKNNKITYTNYGVKAEIIGNVIGHLIANYDIFIHGDNQTKLKTIAYSAIPIGRFLLDKIITITPISNKSCFGGLFRKGFFVISIIDLVRNIFEDINFDSLDSEEKYEKIMKKSIGCISDIFVGWASV